MNNPAWWFSSPLAVGWGLVVILIAVWTLYWKGRALWKAARLGHLGWFIALIILNTAGILDILYIYIFSKPKTSKSIDHHHDKTPAVKGPNEVMRSSENS